MFFSVNFLAQVVSEILGSPKFTLGGLCPRRPPSGKILTHTQELAYRPICVGLIVNFQLRSSINAGLMERSLSNSFALKGPLKWFFWGRG